MMLERSFALNGRTPQSTLEEAALQEIGVTFMMQYMNQLDDEASEQILPKGSWSSHGLSELQKHHAEEKKSVLDDHGGIWRPGSWISNEAQAAQEAVAAANPFVSKQSRRYPFEFVADRLVAPAVDRFGKWHNEECMELKGLLTSLDRQATGRVRFSDFYGQSYGKWHLGEPLDYLRTLGVLDETSASRGPQVLIPNYVLSMSNCVEPSAYYSVCCLSECEGLLSTLEHQVGAPMASAVQITQAVRGIETSSMDGPMGNLTLQLQVQLDEVAEFHKDKIPLHGRLLAQWLHYAFPRECPFPHKRQDVDPVGAGEWLDAGNDLPGTPEEMMRIRRRLQREDAINSGETGGEQGQKKPKSKSKSSSKRDEYDYVDMSQWTLEEELIVNMKDALEPQEMGWLPRLQKLWVRKQGLADLLSSAPGSNMSGPLRILAIFSGIFGVLILAVVIMAGISVESTAWAFDAVGAKKEFSV